MTALQNARDCTAGKQHVFFKYFVKNWESCVDEWAMFERQHVAQLGNDTNNRIDAKFGQSKRVLDYNLDPEQTVRALIAMQEVCEDQYLKDLLVVGTRVSHSNDRELNLLMNVVSEFAYDLIEPEYKAVKNQTVHYSVRVEGGNAIVKSTAASKIDEATEHTVIIEENRCSCFFTQVRLLPCRHVFFYRLYTKKDTVIPMTFINQRWSTRNPINNIGEGEVRAGGYMIRRATHTRTDKLSRGTKFCQLLAYAKPSCTAIAEMAPDEYDRGVEVLKSLAAFLSRGVIPRLVDPATEQVEADQGFSPGPESDSDDGSEESQIPAFKIPDPVRNTTRKQGLAASYAARMAQIRVEASKVASRRASKAPEVSLADVEAQVENDPAHCYDSIILLVTDLQVRTTATETVAVPKRDEHTTMSASTIRFVLDQSTLEDIEKKLANADDDGHTTEADGTEVINGSAEHYVVRVGDGGGYISVSHVATMRAFWNAFDDVYEVVSAVEWLRRQNWQHVEIDAPFDQLGNPSKNLAATIALIVRALPLGEIKTEMSLVKASRLLKFCSDKWLDTTCITAALECFKGGFDDIGVMVPDFLQLRDAKARHSLLSAHSVFDDDTKKIVGVVNTSHDGGTHWLAFFVDRESESCVVYDPLKLPENHKNVELLVQQDIAARLGLKLQYRTHVGMRQKDAANCGLLLLVVH